jgi:hypothetical protein
MLFCATVTKDTNNEAYTKAKAALSLSLNPTAGQVILTLTVTQTLT